MMRPLLCQVERLYHLILLMQVLIFLKLRFVEPPSETYKVLLDLLRSQLTEGSGETIFEIGVAG